ncbi:hypothetical protein [Chryseobacterium hagamense]|nr:hypothetical protein [Chryseobacterium hagamense]
MRKLIIIFLISIITSSCHHEWIIRPEIKGRVISKQNKQIVARVITLPVEGEEYEVAVNKNEGKFYFPRQTIKEWTFLGMEKPKGPPTTNKIIVSAQGYKADTLDYTNYNARNNIVDLGNIILNEEN